jgi:hypothetical protein
MKNLSRPLTNLVFILFILGIFISLYSVFFVMPEAMLQKMGISNTDHTKLDIAKQASISTLIIIGIELLIGLGLIIALLSNNRKFVGTENIVYITNNTDKLQDKTHTEAGMNEDARLRMQAMEIKEEIEHANGNSNKLQKGINQLCKLLEADIAALFVSKEINNRKYIEFILGYAFQLPESKSLSYEYGEGIAGQVAKSGKEINISKVPDGYITVVSGLGKATPTYMLALPILRNSVVIGVLEIASFTSFSQTQLHLAKEIVEILAEYMPSEIKGNETKSIVLEKN